MPTVRVGDNLGRIELRAGSRFDATSSHKNWLCTTMAQLNSNFDAVSQVRRDRNYTENARIA